MQDQLDLNERLVIIKHSDIDDILILDENYRYLMRNSESMEEQEKFEILHNIAQDRIRKLKNNT
jgi:hypothetical protein